MGDSTISKLARSNSATLQAVLVGGVGYASGVVINLVTQDTDGSRFWLLVSGGLIACVGLACAAAAFDAFAKAGRKKLAREVATHRSGYQTLNREISQYIALVRRFELTNPQVAPASVQLMHNACRDLYETLETEYGLGVSVSEHIEFEVTFMTPSMLDNEITIAAWANRDARAPKSLATRRVNPKIYVGTETDRLYQDENRTPRFVSSTDTLSYKELYPGQKVRLKSSVIWPVVDDEFALRGTLVVHCDRVGFFSSSSEKLWRELLEPYTKRLALARVLAGRTCELGLGIAF